MNNKCCEQLTYTFTEGFFLQCIQTDNLVLIVTFNSVSNTKTFGFDTKYFW